MTGGRRQTNCEGGALLQGKTKAKNGGGRHQMEEHYQVIEQRPKGGKNLEKMVEESSFKGILIGKGKQRENRLVSQGNRRHSKNKNKQTLCGGASGGLKNGREQKWGRREWGGDCGKNLKNH